MIYMCNKNLSSQKQTMELIEKITNLGEFKGQTPSSMITLAIPSKYCI